MTRKPIIAGNWKMNNTVADTRDAVRKLVPLVNDSVDVDIVVCPPFTSLAAAVDAAESSNISVGAQNVHWEEKGAYTGEISVKMLIELNVAYAVVGHSERRQYFGETDVNVNRRLHASLQAGLIPIVCVGETLEQRRSGEMEAVITGQIRVCLDKVSADRMCGTVIAYEPVWAIGTGVTATPEQAQEVHSLIRRLLRESYDDTTAETVRIQYGGSVKSSNINDLMSQPDIDGALVGGASLVPDEFGDLIKKAVDN